MLVHVYLGGLSNGDHPKAEFSFLGGGWQSGALYLHMHCTQAVTDNVYLISSKCKGSQTPVHRTQVPCSHIRSLVYRYSYRTNTGLLSYVNNNHHAAINGHST